MWALDRLQGVVTSGLRNMCAVMEPRGVQLTTRQGSSDILAGNENLSGIPNFHEMNLIKAYICPKFNFQIIRLHVNHSASLNLKFPSVLWGYYCFR